MYVGTALGLPCYLANAVRRTPMEQIVRAHNDLSPGLRRELVSRRITVLARAVVS